MPGRMNRSIGTFEPKTVTVPPGSTGGCGFVPIPNASETKACATSSSPSEAASLASGVAVRNGRKIPYSTSNATASRKTAVTTSAGAVDRYGLWTSPNPGAADQGAVPVFNDQ